MTPFQQSILDWYDANRRDLPWRRTRDPYAVWVSEAMLQQTTVHAVIPFFWRWMQAFPTVHSLAQAREEAVLAAWQGLGYYSRARNLHRAAQIIANDGWPATVEQWRSLPGVGDYTAGAVASIAQGLPAALVDGNVERVYARISADPAAGSGLKRAAWDWARGNLVAERPGDWNQALMELGATVCMPRTPACGRCPVSVHCLAQKGGNVADFPAPKPRKEWVRLSHAAVVPVCQGLIGLEQCPPGAWWAGLWQTPRFETAEAAADAYPGCWLVGSFKHTVTRYQITLQVFVHHFEKTNAGLAYVDPKELDSIALTAPAKKAIRLALGSAPTLPGLG